METENVCSFLSEFLWHVWVFFLNIKRKQFKHILWTEKCGNCLICFSLLWLCYWSWHAKKTLFENLFRDYICIAVRFDVPIFLWSVNICILSLCNKKTLLLLMCHLDAPFVMDVLLLTKVQRGDLELWPLNSELCVHGSGKRWKITEL